MCAESRIAFASCLIGLNKPTEWNSTPTLLVWIFFVIPSRDQRAYKKHPGLLDRCSKIDAQFFCCWKDIIFMLVKRENLF